MDPYKAFKLLFCHEYHPSCRREGERATISNAVSLDEPSTSINIAEPSSRAYSRP
jgi:hypothetical protein